ncbi:hypothetical protein GQ600_20497 [Phytophthora cactorum]|nr:hypothetical protein GQ600_20497 [Phytophthora cactorum]
MRLAISLGDYNKHLNSSFSFLLHAELGFDEGEMGFVRAFGYSTSRKSYQQQVLLHWRYVALFKLTLVVRPALMCVTRLEPCSPHQRRFEAEMELDGCVETLMFLQAVAEMNYAKKITDLGQMATMSRRRAGEFCPPYAYRLVEEQYLVSKDRKTHYKMEDLHKVCTFLLMVMPKHLITLTLRYVLIFKHIPPISVFVRVHEDDASTMSTRHYPIRHIAPRWKISWKLNQPAGEEEFQNKRWPAPSALTARRHHILNGTTKYKPPDERGISVADIMSRKFLLKSTI